ncbi:MAG: TonB-dependent receptor [Acidobacteriota bacterium]|nr:TonB-dependent receptor [Acidobacteriota bacterium]MDQ7087728.1 TonB-dependent receptor [Acidobacteriota bacterium]
MKNGWCRRSLPAVILLWLCWVGLSSGQGASNGGIRGLVYDADFDVPLAGVRVEIAGTRHTALTSDAGNFVLEQLPPGKYTVVCSKAGYQRRVIADVAVSPGRLSELRVELSIAVLEMDELVVTGDDFLSGTEVDLLEIRASAVTLQDAISSELFKKADASDVAGAIKMVVGASVVDGKYATVRGLSDRYTGTTLNGIRVPSADPRKRAVQLDVFPTGTVESITVTKTFTPDLQGDFTGGGVDVRTKSIPENYLLSTSVAVEYDDLATGNGEFLTYRGGGVDPTGFGGSDRSMPDVGRVELTKSFSAIRYRPRVLPADLEAALAYDKLTRMFVPVMGTSRKTAPANGSFSLVSGNKYSIGAWGRIGVLGALSYSHKYHYYDDGINNKVGVSGSDGAITLLRPRTDSKGTDELLIGGLGALVFQPNDDHEFTLRFVGNQSASDEARFQVSDDGSSVEQINVIQNQSLRYVERTVASLQLQGKHDFEGWPVGDGLHLDWSVASNLTRQKEPDVRFFRNLFTYFTERGFGVAQFRTSGVSPSSSTRRIFREIEETGMVYAANAELPLRVLGDREARLKGGFYFEDDDRTYEQESFFYDFPSRQCCRNPERIENRSRFSWITEDPAALWSDVFLDADRIGLAPNVDSPHVADNQLLWTLTPLNQDVDYVGRQRIGAFYLMAEWPLLPSLKLVAGGRWERTELGVIPAGPAGRVEIIEVRPESGDRGIVEVPEEEGVARIDDRSVLPSVGLIWELRDGMQVRASWSRTLARPTLRELAPVATEEFLFGDEFVGNPRLEMSKITNWDLRWEWFRRPGEVLALSVFRKKIDKPIEYLNFGAAGRSFTQPVNFDTGRILGVEAEARAPLDRFGRRLRHFTVSANYTWLDSEVDIPGFEQEALAAFALGRDRRALAGQPASIANFNLSYDNEDTGLSASVFYNRVGERLRAGAAVGDVETGGVPDALEAPFSSLNVKVSQKLGAVTSLSLSAKNLLADDKQVVYRTPEGAEAIKSLVPTARRYKIALRWSW